MYTDTSNLSGAAGSVGGDDDNPGTLDHPRHWDISVYLQVYAGAREQPHRSENGESANVPAKRRRFGIEL
jgi:hypothetical protein